MKKLFTREAKQLAVRLICSTKKSIIILTIFLLSGFIASSQIPTFTVKFANPQIDFTTQTLSVDVEFQSDMTDQRLFGMNVRFFYDASVLDFMYFYNFEAGYAASSPNPPYISTSAPSSGPLLFTFIGPAEYVNGAIQLINTSAPPVHISTTGWTKLYSIKFQIENMGTGDFCPSILWDLEENPLNGSFLDGSSGVVMTAVAPPPAQTMSIFEQVVQFNWAYSGTTGYPFGFPVPNICLTSQSTIVATADEYTVNGCVGSPNVGNVLANDLINGAPVNPSLFIVEQINNGGLFGAQITSDGNLMIPAGTTAGTYVMTYSVCEANNPGNCAQANVTVVVYENVVECPDDMEITNLQLPFLLNGGTPAGGIYSGNYVTFNPQSGAYQFYPTYLGDFNITYMFTDSDGCLLSCDYVISVIEEPLATITTRFANPQIDFQSQTFTVDVEFQSDMPDQQLFGMNVRFFYDASALDFMYFYNFEGGYAAFSPNPPYISTGAPSSGPDLFAFNGPAEYVNGAVQLVDPDAQPVYISSTGWTKVYSMMFQIENLGFGNFCPSIVWDLEENPENGSFLTGSDGVVITLVTPPPYQSKPGIEQVVQFNWEYSGTTGLPFGNPVQENCLTLQTILLANADDFSAFPVNGCVGTTNAGNVLANDLINGVAIAPSQVMIAMLNDGGLAGVLISSAGNLMIPAGTSAGSYVISYSICEVVNANNCSSSTATVEVFENTVQCPPNVEICELALPLVLLNATPTGGVYSGDYITFNGTMNAYEFNSPVCGSFIVNYNFTDNEGCLHTCNFQITVIEVPKPVIAGLTELLLGTTAVYSVSETPLCNNPVDITYTWSLTGGGSFVGSNTGTEVTVLWNNTIGTDQLSVTAALSGQASCNGYSAAFAVTRVRPILAGQIKYWNQNENTMPSPYATKPGNPSPFDHFYVTLCKSIAGNVTEIETVTVDTYLTDNQTELLSYFEFSLPVDAYGYSGYFLKVWDGGLCYQYGSNPPATNGTYLKDNYTFNNWGGVNATDVQAIDKMEKSQNIRVTLGYNWVGSNTFTPRYGYFSHSVADVNSSNPYVNGGIKNDDEKAVNDRITGKITKFPNSQPGINFSPNFRVTGRMVQGIPSVTWPQPFTFTNAGDLNFLHSNASYLDNSGAKDHKYTSVALPLINGNNFINIYYTALGDINASYIPQNSFKGNNTQITLLTKGTIEVKKGDIVDIPVRIESPAEIGALTLGFSYDNTLIEVLDVNYEIKYIDHQQGVVNFIWYDSEAIYFDESATIATFTVRVLSDILDETPLFTLSTDAELADGDANVLSNQHLITSFLTTTKLSAHGILNLVNYPNPFRQSTTIVYNLPESGKVTLSVFNNMGQMVKTLVSEFQSEGNKQIECEMSAVPAGTYRYTILLETDKGYQTSSGTMVLMP